MIRHYYYKLTHLKAFTVLKEVLYDFLDINKTFLKKKMEVTSDHLEQMLTV